MLASGISFFPSDGELNGVTMPVKKYETESWGQVLSFAARV